jgi:hypothetical protein
VIDLLEGEVEDSLDDAAVVENGHAAPVPEMESYTDPESAVVFLEPVDPIASLGRALLADELPTITLATISNLPDAFANSDLFRTLQSKLSTIQSSPSALPHPIPRPPFGGLLKFLTQRSALQTLRDPGIVYIRTGAALAIGILDGLIFFQQDPSVEAGRVNALLFLMCVFGWVFRGRRARARGRKLICFRDLTDCFAWFVNLSSLNLNNRKPELTYLVLMSTAFGPSTHLGKASISTGPWL